MDDLKPCPVPWCEGEVIEIVYSPWTRGYGAVCQHCNAQGPSLATQAAAVVAWNTRPAATTLAALSAENARLREALLLMRGGDKDASETALIYDDLRHVLSVADAALTGSQSHD